jgi:O-antigen ligase
VGATVAFAVEVKVLSGSKGVFSIAPDRLAWPIDYANGEAALLWLSVPALLAGAATERIRPLARGLVAALAALVLATGLMTLSRGAALALVATLFVCVAFATDRSRIALTIAALALPVAAFAAGVTTGAPGEVASDAVSRGRAAALSAAGAAILVFLLASFERLRPIAFRRVKAPVAIAAWACIIAVGGSVFIVHYGRPDTWLTARWHEFRDLNAPRPSDVARFGNASSNRYEYWRVAGVTLRDRPFTGVGAGAFGVPWFRHRAITESVTDAHSWEAGALAETGVVGFVLLAAALLLPLAQLAKARKELGGFASVAVGGTLAYFILHGTVDWLFLIPAVSVPAFVALGACASAGSVPELRLAPGRQRAALAVGALVATVVAIPVYLSATLTARAENRAASSTPRALDDLSLAARVNPWAVQPKIVRSQILLQVRRTREAIAVARQATKRGPELWITWRALADAERTAGNQRAASEAFRRVRTLDPKAERTEP